MTDNLQLLELVEEALDSGRSAEEVCAEFPELLPELRRRLQRCQIVQDELGALFPTEMATLDAAERQTDESFPSLPEIPGYELVSILGRGGMGVVYKAEHLALKRFVAIKMLLSGIHASASERARLKREAEALARLTHPHIVQVHDVGELEGRPYFTMEFVEGGNLAEQLGSMPQPAGHCAAMLISLASAVEAAHQCDILHRDLKPANVLLTVDGVPKISDFGLARQVEDADLITLTGARLGTPSYMAPEQASARWGEVGRTSDVYALGAILFEMMTGRPPFRGESPADTERQLLHEEVVPPSRLNTRVPRDLETICLKCLQKDQDRRYASAAALAEDLARFEKGEPITARRVGALERTVKWIRRRPSVATAVGSAAVLALVFAAAATWIVSQRATTRRLVEADLTDIASSQKSSNWKEANLAIDRAAMHLGTSGPKDLQRRLDAARRDSKLVDDLDKLRMEGAVIRSHSDDDYREALQRAQVGNPSDPPQVVAERIRESNIRYALITALDDWLCFSNNYRAWVLAVLREADHDPTGWRDRLRDPAVWENNKALAAAATTAPYADQPVPFLLSVANQLMRKPQDFAPDSRIAFFKRVQQAHPDDFWINFDLAVELGNQQNVADQLQYLRAAAAIRPDSATVRIFLGNVLFTLQQRDEAAVQYREAVRLEPGSREAMENLGIVLSELGQDREAVSLLEKVVRINPGEARNTRNYYFLGRSLKQIGREQEAASALREYLRRHGTFPDAQRWLQDILIRQGHWDQLESVWQDAIEADPTRHDNWDGYAEYCLFLGHTDDYRKIRGHLLDQFDQDKSATTCDRAGRACLLLGDDSQANARAAAMIDQALQDKGPDGKTYHSNFMVGKGLAEYRLGHLDAALSAVEGDGAGALKPMPQLIAAMAHYRKGEQQAARRLLVQSVFAFDWHRDHATTHEAWIYHVLRREAEQLILPNFDALIKGTAHPQDNDERLGVMGFCTFNGLQGQRAQLWIDALQADPQLAKDHLDAAGQIAAAAGSGIGSDAGKFTDEDRARWRQFAFTSLSTELAGFEDALKTDPRSTAAIRDRLTNWPISPDLVGFRDAAATHLPKAEQEQWASFWTRAHSLLDSINQSK